MLTRSDTPPLRQSIKPFKLRVDWLCWHSYGDKVVVELHIMDSEPKILHRCSNPPEAAGWARKWLEDRGFDWWCDIDTAQRQNWHHITLHPLPHKAGDN